MLSPPNNFTKTNMVGKTIRMKEVMNYMTIMTLLKVQVFQVRAEASIKTIKIMRCRCNKTLETNLNQKRTMSKTTNKLSLMKFKLRTSFVDITNL